MELTENEIFFIEVSRSFNFIRTIGYEGSDFCLGGREIWVSFYNWKLKRKIIFLWEENGHFNIEFKRKKIFYINRQFVEFKLRDVYDVFDRLDLKNHPLIGISNIINSNAEFVQQHLMSVIKGEKWIDELLKEKNKTL